MKTVLLSISVVTLLLLSASCSNEPGGGEPDSARTPPADSAAVVDAGHVPPVGGADQAASGSTLGTQLSALESLVDLVVADAAELPRTEFDPAALAVELGTDPQAHFEWVRDRTWWAPYRGLLRGAKGVMLDRVGSNVDRAVLLGDLLRHAGHTVRLAHAELPEERARELLAQVRPIPDERRAPVGWKPGSPERDQATDAIVPGFEETLQQRIGESERLADAAGALVRAQAEQLTAMVREVGLGGREEEDRAAIAAMRDHWWVELEAGDQWIAMDVLLPDAKPGGSVAAAAGRRAWMPTDDLPAIPEEEWHAVQIRVVVERYEAGETTESTPLETTLRPAVVFDRPVTLRHMPIPWPDELPPWETDPNALGNAAVNVKVWVPVLQVGDELVAQSGISESGDLVASPFASGGAISDTGGGGLMGGMDMALGGGESASSHMSAEWIDYEIRVPGEPPQRLRRSVFDLLGPVRRAENAVGFDASTNELLVQRYEALLSSMDILLQPSGFTEEFVIHLMTAGVVANAEALRDLARQRDPARAKSLAFDILDRIDVWGPLPDLVLWRSALDNSPADGFVDRPNVLNYRVTQPVVAGSGVALRELIDIASNPTGVRRGAHRSPFEVRVRQGVADTVAEILALGSGLQGVENTASVFALAGAGPDSSVLIGPGDAATVRGLGWPADAAARLAQNVDDGFMAVALKQPVTLAERKRLGWWRIDPTSGETIGVMDTGFHASLTEKQELEETLARIRTWLTSKARKEARRTMTPAQRAFDDAVALRLARIYRQLEELIALIP